MTNTELREELVVLLIQCEMDLETDTENVICDGCGLRPISEACVAIADHLIANGVTLNQWIPVTERLPKEDKKILVLCKNGAMFVGVMGKYYGGTESRFRTCTALNSTKLLNKGRVTHWMPLPGLPKEG